MTRTLTPEQKLARKNAAIDRKYAREIAQLQRQIERMEKARALSDAITKMALRHATSDHRMMCAFTNPNHTYLGKPEKHWERATNRQYRALCRLTYALRDLAEKGA